MFLRLYAYKDLLFVFIWREFVIRYRQSVIGILWAILQPLSIMLLFVLVFGVILQTSQKEYPYALFYLSGIIPWTFFAGSINFSVGCLSGNFNLITKIYFPREIVPLSGVVINFADFIIGFILFLGLIIYYGIGFTLNFLWIVPLLFLLVVFTTGFGLLLSALNVYYRDVKLASSFIVQFLFFATPVVYSLDTVNNKWALLLYMNPLTYIVESIRRVTIEGRGLVLWQLGLETLLILIFFIIVYKIFTRIERAFADVI